MAVCPDVICSEGGPVLVARIGDLPMGSGTPDLQCWWEKGFMPCLITYRTNGSSGDPTDLRRAKKPLKYRNQA